MRSRTRRLLLSVAIIAAAPLMTILTPGTAHAGTCYMVQVGPQWFTVCP
jgi:hypothetical protein